MQENKLGKKILPHTIWTKHNKQNKTKMDMETEMNLAENEATA